MRLEAFTGIGRLGRAIDDINISVDYLSAKAGIGGINIREADGLTIQGVSVSATSQVDSLLLDSQISLEEATLNDIEINGDGSVVIN